MHPLRLDDNDDLNLLAGLKRQIAQRDRAVSLNNGFLAVGLHTRSFHFGWLKPGGLDFEV
jgi:hypothetical protein